MFLSEDCEDQTARSLIVGTSQTPQILEYDPSVCTHSSEAVLTRLGIGHCRKYLILNGHLVPCYSANAVNHDGWHFK